MKPKEICDLCDAILDSQTEKPSVFNSPLFETKHFKLLPSIGPLEPGHILIISKLHYESLSSMPKDEIEDLLSIVEKIRRIKEYKNCLFTEHGSNNEQKAGACVIHTHIHVIPKFDSEFNILDGFLPQINLYSFNSIHEISDPYILNFNLSNQLRAYKAYNVHSQQMRKAICHKYNRPDSDWKNASKIELINESINIWKSNG